MQNIKIQNNLDLCVIDIEGTIGIAEEWQFENAGQRVATYEKFRQSIERIKSVEAESIVVNIRSTGGDVNDAMLIYEALTSLSIPITTRCYGYVASAATVIAQAATAGERQISANSLYLIHNSTCSAEGNATELASRVELLQKTDERLAELYARHSGHAVEEFKALMAEEGGNGRWLNANEVIAFGLADKVIDTATEPSSAESTVTNFLKKVGRKLGITPDLAGELAIAADATTPSVTHTESEHSQQLQAKRLFTESQRAAKPTALIPVEDPALNTTSTPTANQAAYSSDAQAFREF